MSLGVDDILAIGAMNQSETALLQARIDDPDDLGRFFPGVEEAGYGPSQLSRQSHAPCTSACTHHQVNFP